MAVISTTKKEVKEELLAGKPITKSNLKNGEVLAYNSLKRYWEAKTISGGASSYNDLTDKPTIPTALSSLSEDTTHRVVTDTEKTTWNGKADATHIHTGTLIFTYNL